MKDTLDDIHARMMAEHAVAAAPLAPGERMVTMLLDDTWRQHKTVHYSCVTPERLRSLLEIKRLYRAQEECLASRQP